MKKLRILWLIFIGCIFLSACSHTEEVLLKNFNINQTPQSYDLSGFLGNHRVIDLEEDESFLTSAIITVIKRDHIFYVLSSFRCTLFDSDGKFIKVVPFDHLFEDENVRITGYDISMVNGKPELWIGRGADEQRLYRISLDDDQRSTVIDIEVPFDHFKIISQDIIELALTHNHHLLAVYNLNNRAVSYGFKKKLKDGYDGERFMKYEDKYLLAYPNTTLAAYYDEQSKDFKEVLIIEDNEQINTWQKQTELMESYGIERGLNLALKNHYSIEYVNKTNGVSLLSFAKGDKKYMAIQREGGSPFKIVEVLPNKYNTLKNDISSYNNVFRQLLNHFGGRTDSDDSILIYLLEDTRNTFDVKKRRISIIEINS